MAKVKWEKDGTVAIMIMNDGDNQHNPEWTQAMITTYGEILADEEITALVLTSSDPRNFCLGVDVEWMLQRQGEKDFDTVSQWLYSTAEVFKAMLMAPFPTIAAINGHAFGNGAMLAGACDFRFMRADRGYFCLPEIDLGIQMAPSMIEWMKRIMPYHLFTKMVFSGDRIRATELEKHGTIIKACEDAESTVNEAINFARKFNKPRVNVAEMKKRVYKHIIDKMENEDPYYYDNKPENITKGQSPVFMISPQDY